LYKGAPLLMAARKTSAQVFPKPHANTHTQTHKHTHESKHASIEMHINTTQRPL